MNETQQPQPPVPHPSAGTPQPDEVPTQVLGADQTRAFDTDPTQAGPGPAAGPSSASQPSDAANPPAGGYPPPGGSPSYAGSLPPGATPPAGGYPPVGGYPPQGPSSFPPAPMQRLTRSRSSRRLGGVCGGLARYWNTDATLLRILTVVLTLVTGGAFLIGYIIAWIAIPEEPWPPAGDGTHAEQAGYAAGGNPAYPGAPASYAELPPRERSYLGWLTVSVAILATGVLGLIGFLVPASVGIWGVMLGVSLAILGIGMLVGTRYGRARWLLWLAVPLAFVTFATVSASNLVRDNPNWGRWTASSGAGEWGGLTVGDRTWTVAPADAADSPVELRLSAGAATLDLTELTALGAEDPGRARQSAEIDAGVGVGELIILIPRDMRVTLSGTVELGQIVLPGDSTPVREGSNLSIDTTLDPVAKGAPAYIVTIDASIGAGNLEVRREAA